MAHDIRQMLAVIVGRTDLLLERGPDPDLARHLLAVKLAAEDAAAMLKRLDRTDGPLGATEPAELRQVVEDCAGLLLPGTGGVVLDNRVPAGLWAEVPAQILREVINNLLLNSLAVMPLGGTVTATGSGEDSTARLVVSDTGPGIDPELAGRIFQSGFTTSGQTGRGLGLAGCRRLLGRYSGQLDLDPAPAAGAVFIMDLPLASGPGPASELKSVEPAADILEPGEILVVDDESSVQEMLADLLGELGWRPIVVPDAEQALGEFSSGRFPVALVDQSLPGMSGLELASSLRRLDSEIVLVLVTGWGNEDIMSRALDSGFDLTAEKPLTVGKIRHLLAQAAVLLNTRGTEREES